MIPLWKSPMELVRVGAQSGLGPGPGWGPYGPIGPLWARFWLKTNNFMIFIKII